MSRPRGHVHWVPDALYETVLSPAHLSVYGFIRRCQSKAGYDMTHDQIAERVNLKARRVREVLADLKGWNMVTWQHRAKARGERAANVYRALEPAEWASGVFRPTGTPVPDGAQEFQEPTGTPVPAGPRQPAVSSSANRQFRASPTGTPVPAPGSRSSLEVDLPGKESTATPTPLGADAPVVRVNASGFSRFWTKYPKKVGKLAAAREWDKLRPSPDDVDRMLAAIEVQQRTDQWARGLILDPERWLKGRRWTDEILVIGNTPKVPPLDPAAYRRVLDDDSLDPAVEARFLRDEGTPEQREADRRAILRHRQQRCQQARAENRVEPSYTRAEGKAMECFLR